MSRIIVSYRRSDTQAVSGRIFDRLTAHFGATSVFMDVDNIPFGIDFRQHIKNALSRADVLLAIVGPQWLAIGTDGRSRLQDANDPVRAEIETALTQQVHIIPVLVNGASMPDAAVLPDSLKDFSFLNAAPVDSGRDFHAHVDRLIKAIDQVVALDSRQTAETTPAVPSTKAKGRVIAVAAVLLLICGVAAWQLKLQFIPPPTPDAGLSSIAPRPSISATSSASAPPIPSTDDIQWESLKGTSDIGLLRRFVALNPDSKHRPEAEQRIAALTALLGAAPNNAVAPAAVAADQSQATTPQPSASSSTGSFDGIWVTEIVCDKQGDTLGWSRQCVGTVKNNVFHCEFGTAGQPGWATYDGTIKPDGSVTLIQDGIGTAQTSLDHRSGTRAKFPYVGRFEATRGTALRAEGRICHMTLVRQ
jgi:hypothetical protein